MEDEVKIKRSRLLELLLCEAKMAKLESGGVDNWQWYSESLNEDEDWASVEERITKQVSELSH